MDLITMIMACSLYRDNSIVNAMVELGSKNKPLLVSTINDDNSKKETQVASPAAGEAYLQQQLAQGRDAYIGLMQIPSGWLKKYRKKTSPGELFRPCKNMVIATTILNHAAEICAKQFNRDDRCVLSIYHTGAETPAGQAYADSVIAYAASHQVPPTPQYEKTAPSDEQQMGFIPAEVELPEPQFTTSSDS